MVPALLIGLVVNVSVPPDAELLVRIKLPVPVMPPLNVIAEESMYAFAIVRLFPFKLIAPVKVAGERAVKPVIVEVPTAPDPRVIGLEIV